MQQTFAEKLKLQQEQQIKARKKAKQEKWKDSLTVEQKEEVASKHRIAQRVYQAKKSKRKAWTGTRSMVPYLEFLSKDKEEQDKNRGRQTEQPLR